MAQYGAHFTLIESMLEVYEKQMHERDVIFETAVDRESEHRRSYHYLFKVGEETIRKSIIVTEINKDNKFMVTFEMAQHDLDFVTTSRSYERDADSENDLDRLVGSMAWNFLNEKIDVKLFPTKRMVDHVAQINDQWFKDNYCRAMLHLDSDEYGDEWKIRLQHKDNPKEIYADNLPIDVPGLYCSIMHRAWGRGYVSGRNDAAVRIAEQFGRETIQQVINLSHMRTSELNEDPYKPVYDFLNTGHLYTKP